MSEDMGLSLTFGGVFLWVIYSAVIIIGGLGWNYLWAWMDDSKPSTKNPFIKTIMSWMGYEDGGSNYSFNGYRKKGGGQEVSGDAAFFKPLIILLPLPWIIYAILSSFLVPIVIGIVVGVLFTARLARRQSKLFKNHAEDKNAHK